MPLPVPVLATPVPPKTGGAIPPKPILDPPEPPKGDRPKPIRARVEPAALSRIPRILSGISRVELNATIRATAGAYQDPLLRSLDAIHLATAQSVADATGTELSAFVTYDKRLIAAARAVGVHVEHPGARY